VGNRREGKGRAEKLKGRIGQSREKKEEKDRVEELKGRKEQSSGSGRKSL
jgi:hypothetical protein